MRVARIETLEQEIKELHNSVKKYEGKPLGEKYMEKLKQKVNEYIELKKQYKTCQRCGHVIDNSEVEKKLAFSCRHIEVYQDIGVCDCGKINVFARERMGECHSCRLSEGLECTFKMQLNFDKLMY